MMFSKNTILYLSCFLLICANVAYTDNQMMNNTTPILYPSKNAQLYCPQYNGCGFDQCLFMQNGNDTVNQPFIWGMDFFVTSVACGYMKVEIQTPPMSGASQGNAMMFCATYSNYNSDTGISIAEVTINKPSGVNASQFDVSVQDGDECMLVSTDADSTVRFICGMPYSCQSSAGFTLILPSQISQLYCQDSDDDDDDDDDDDEFGFGFGFGDFDTYDEPSLYMKSYNETMTNQYFLSGQDLMIYCDILQFEMSIPQFIQPGSTQYIGNMTVYCATFYNANGTDMDSFTAAEITFKRPDNTSASDFSCTARMYDDDDDDFLDSGDYDTEDCTLVSSDQDPIVKFIYGIPSSCSLTKQ